VIFMGGVLVGYPTGAFVGDLPVEATPGKLVAGLARVVPGVQMHGDVLG
jgi:hypothetical protein